MTKQIYRKQAELLLAVLPEAAKETCFAMHGGTAINLFIREMPRLSVDIDLTYLPIEDRPTSLNNIAKALQRIMVRVERLIPNGRVQHKQDIRRRGSCRLFYNIELNLDILIFRNYIAKQVTRPLILQKWLIK